MEKLSDERLRNLAEDDVNCMLCPWPEVQQMFRELLDLRNLCSEVYEVVGCLALHANVFQTEKVADVLDNLAAAADGEKIPHQTLLPFHVQSLGQRMSFK